MKQNESPEVGQHENLIAIIRAQNNLISLYQEYVAKTAGAMVSTGGSFQLGDLPDRIGSKRREIELLKENK